MADKLNHILKLGDPRLHERSEDLHRDDLTEALEKARFMGELIVEFRKRYGAGRAMAAPQIGYMKRIIVINTEGVRVMINPVLEKKSQETMELWDDCMSFPTLLVKVKRHRRCRIRYLDENWNEQSQDLENDLSELLQHEYDHLDGILATQRAIDNRSFALQESFRP